MGDPPSVELAESRARRKRLHHYDEDERGIYILDSAQQYSLTASHRDLGEQSTGLALYFDTIVHFAILMFCMLVIVGLYPLIDAHQNSKLAKSYEVRQITANVTEAAQPGYQPFTQVCDRQGTKSSILAVSHGSRCNDKFTASYYTCPTYCDYNVTSDASTVALIAAAASAANVESLETDIPVGVYAMQLVSMFVLLVWLSYFHKQQLVTAQEVNARSVTAGDYAAFITGLGSNEYTREDLAKFMAHYGEVASVVYTKNIGTLLKAEHDLANARARLHELRAWRESGDAGNGGWVGKLFRLVYLGGSYATDAYVSRVESRLEKLEAKIARLSNQPIRNVGEAFVIFNYEAHANNLFNDHRRDVAETIDDLLKCRPGPPRFNGRRIGVEPPPEVSDVNWENFDVRGMMFVFRTTVNFLVMFAAVFLGALLQYYFERLRHDIRVRTYDEEVKSAVTGAQEDGDESMLRDVTMSALTALSSSVIVFVNVMLTTVAKLLSKYQRFSTRTNYEASLMLKLTIVHVINSVIVPILTTRCDGIDNGECLFYAPGGLIEQAFYLQVFNAFVPDLISFTDVPSRLRRWLFLPLARTQNMLDTLMEPPEFIMAEKLAAVCKTIALAILYGPVLPVSYAIALIGLTITYWSDKYIALRRCKKPVRLRNKSTVSVVNTVNILALGQALLSFLVFFAGEDRFQFWLWAVIVWACFNVFPVKRACGIRRDEALEEGGTGDVSYQSNIGWTSKDKDGGEREEDPASSPTTSPTTTLPQLRTLSGAGAEEEAHDTVTLTREERDRAKFIHCKLLRIKPEEYEKGRIEMYYPPIPAAVSDQTAANIVDDYRMFEKAVPADPSLLPGQKSASGGARNVRRPDRRAMAAATAMRALNMHASSTTHQLTPVTTQGQLQQYPPDAPPQPLPPIQTQQLYYQPGVQQQPAPPQQYVYYTAQPQQYGGYGVPQQQPGQDDGWHSNPPHESHPISGYDAYNRAGYG